MTDIKDRIMNRINHLLEIAYDHGFSIRAPKVRFDLTGRAAGTASVFHDEYEVNFNMEIAENPANTEEYIRQTVAHEIAHILVWVNYPHKTQPHGREWRNIMIMFGLVPNRTHRYDMSTVKVRRQKKHLHVCSGCGAEFMLSTTRHNRILKGTRYRHSCGGLVI